jgi:hypothetical protein
MRGLVLLLAALVAGCQSLYFAPAPAPAEAPSLRLAQWPDREYWWGLVFNGEKIGFSHLAIAPVAGEPALFELRSDAAFLLRFLGFEKKVALKAHDVVREDLRLVRFRYDYAIDGNTVALEGEVRGGHLHVRIEHGGELRPQTHALQEPVYPQSAIALLPSLRGLASGREYRYRVYSGELQAVADVVQAIGPYQSSTLFSGRAWKVHTRMEGYRVETWIDAGARPVLEIAMNGVLISGLESEARARGYLATASLNRTEALLDFARVRVEPPLPDARRITRLSVALSGADRAIPSDTIQRCMRSGAETTCDVTPNAASAATDGNDPRYLASTFPVPSRNPAIVAQAHEIAGGATTAHEKVGLVVKWMDANVKKSPVDAFSALDVLRRREAECQGHAWLYAALARALGIPTRVVNGIVYSEEHRGFLYHAWAESLVDGRWVAVDPTFGAVPADATHVKLVEGEALGDVTPLADWIGRLQVRVIEIGR